jgi:DNA-binding transcriptional LysR family regulator
MHHADPQSLRLFVAVCECGTIARAAEREFIAPSALSKRLADLEDMLGTALLTRSQRGVSPTPAGEALLEHSRLVLQSLQRLHAEVGEHADGIRGHVRLAAIRAAVVDSLQEAISEFLVAHPRVGITLDEQVSAEVARSVMTGTAEIGIGRDFEPSRELRVHPYGSDVLAAVVGLQHPLAAREHVDFIETLEFDHVCTSQGNSHAKFTERAARNAGRAVNMRLCVSNPIAALRFIADGLGVGIFPLKALGNVAETYRVRAIVLNDEWARREQSICTSATEPLSPAARRLLQHLLARQPANEA